MIKTESQCFTGLTFIDLFAGLGGFRLALESVGAECVFSSECDDHVRSVYTENFGDVPAGDITLIDAKTIPDHDILCAGFPCQSFSISGLRNGFSDSRGSLFFEIARIIKVKKPKVVIMENVKNFATHDGGNTLCVVQTTLQALGYTFYQKVLNAADFGVPQKRERLYMVCFRNDLDVVNFTYPHKQGLEVHVEDLLFADDLVNDLYVSRTDIQYNSVIDDTYSNVPIRLGIVNKGCQGERIYSIKGVAITLSAHGGGVFAKTGGYLIGGRLRKLHPKECARLMGFPDDYKISENKAQAYKQFGNSVVVDVLQLLCVQIGYVLSSV